MFIVSRENSSPGRMTKCRFVFLLCTSVRRIDWSFLGCKFFASHFPIPFTLSFSDIFTLSRVNFVSFLFRVGRQTWIFYDYALCEYETFNSTILPIICIFTDKICARNDNNVIVTISWNYSTYVEERYINNLSFLNHARNYLKNKIKSSVTV